MITSFSTSQNWGEFFFKCWFLVINVIVLKVLHNCDSNLEYGYARITVLLRWQLVLHSILDSKWTFNPSYETFLVLYGTIGPVMTPGLWISKTFRSAINKIGVRFGSNKMLEIQNQSTLVMNTIILRLCKNCTLFLQLYVMIEK